MTLKLYTPCTPRKIAPIATTPLFLLCYTFLPLPNRFQERYFVQKDRYLERKWPYDHDKNECVGIASLCDYGRGTETLEAPQPEERDRGTSRAPIDGGARGEVVVDCEERGESIPGESRAPGERVFGREAKVVRERARFLAAVLFLWKADVYPSPTALNMALHGRRSNNLSGRETTWRRALMKEFGIPLQRKTKP